MHGDGAQTRDYVFLNDVVSAMIAAATAPGMNHMTLNIGSGSETSVRDLVRLVMEVTGTSVEVITNPKNDPGVSRMRAGLSLAHEKRSCQPRFLLAEGLRLTLERDARFRREPPTRPVGRS